MALLVRNADKFLQDSLVDLALAESIADIAGVLVHHVNVTLEVTNVRRLEDSFPAISSKLYSPLLLGAAQRQLQTLPVMLSYVILWPDSSAKSVSSANAVSLAIQSATLAEVEELFANAINRKVGLSVYTVVVISVESPALEYVEYVTTTQAIQSPEPTDGADDDDNTILIVGSVSGSLAGCLLCCAAVLMLDRARRRRRRCVTHEAPNIFSKVIDGNGTADFQGAPLANSIAAPIDHHVIGAACSVVDDHEEDDEEKEVIGRYRILKTLGRGSFGTVLLGEAGVHRVAIKLIPCDHLDVDVATKARSGALAEAELLQNLKHPNIVSCHEARWDSTRQVVWLAMDLMDGGDLRVYIDQRRAAGTSAPDFSFVREVIFGIGGALSYVHLQGILHRDVKPSNILLGTSLKLVKLSDFGIAKILEATKLTSTVIGTPFYLSPEMVRGGSYGAPADAWALGVCLYELLTLRRPFEAGNQLLLARQIVEQEPNPLPSCPLDVSSAVMGLLCKDPQRRLQVIQAMRCVTPPSTPRDTVFS